MKIADLVMILLATPFTIIVLCGYALIAAAIVANFRAKRTQRWRAASGDGRAFPNTIHVRQARRSGPAAVTG